MRSWDMGRIFKCVHVCVSVFVCEHVRLLPDVQDMGGSPSCMQFTERQ